MTLSGFIVSDVTWSAYTQVLFSFLRKMHLIVCIRIACMYVHEGFYVLYMALYISLACHAFMLLWYFEFLSSGQKFSLRVEISG